MSLRLSRFVGHRGIAAEAPENTLTGFRLAAEAGFSWVEFDVMLSADDVPVLHHDEVLGRTDNGVGPVAAQTAAQLKTLDAGAWFGPGFAGERIPTFEETISCCRALGLSMNVEIKPTTGREVRTAEIVSAFLNRLCPDLTDRIIVSSFVPECLRVAQEKAPDFLRGYLSDTMAEDWHAAAKGLGCFSIHPNHACLDAALITAVHESGFRVLTYTVNDPARAASLIGWGVDAVITDELLADALA
ncbi:glycerophosphodiester phosphodiesterase [Nisaea sp.]|uniref:glycerophosphodiester phosphodiesterase n=1 Tax=Nisaea sp. TaxID=2024842 RepID=UPI0032EB4729